MKQNQKIKLEIIYNFKAISWSAKKMMPVFFPIKWIIVSVYKAKQLDR